MALLSFPSSPINGQLYPPSPVAGQNQYEWEAATQTWRLLGAATTVTPGCYGDAYTVPTFCVDAQGRITSVTDVSIAANAPDLQQVTTQGAVTTDTIDVGGLIAAGLTYPNVDGAGGEFLTTDGAGTLAWAAAGTVTDVTAGTGLTGGTIIGSGTIALDTAYTDTLYVQQSSLPLPISQGGTGEITANDALNALLPSQSGQIGNLLTTDGTNASWLNISLSLVSQAATAPAFSTSPGLQGQVASDATYFYYHDGSNWNRVAWDTTPW